MKKLLAEEAKVVYYYVIRVFEKNNDQINGKKQSDCKEKKANRVSQ